jgi:hypothetical protein
MSANHATATVEGLFLPPGPGDFLTEPVFQIELDLATNTIVGDERHGGVRQKASFGAQPPVGFVRRRCGFRRNRRAYIKSSVLTTKLLVQF